MEGGVLTLVYYEEDTYFPHFLVQCLPSSLCSILDKIESVIRSLFLSLLRTCQTDGQKTRFDRLLIDVLRRTVYFCVFIATNPI